MAGTDKVKIVKADQRHTSDLGWLKTSWLFSFDDYFDPDNVEFGAIRVFNDDVIAPGKGFPAHRHNEMEIVTLVLEGELTHRDSAGNEGLLRPGDAQRMTAGTGVLHSEMNLGKKPVHMYQIWFLPDRGEMKPSYVQKSFPLPARRNVLLPLVSGEGKVDSIDMRSPATLYGSVLDKGHKVVIKSTDRLVFIYLTSGELMIGDTAIREKDQARIEGDGPLTIAAAEASDLVLIDMPRS